MKITDTAFVEEYYSKTNASYGKDSAFVSDYITINNFVFNSAISTYKKIAASCVVIEKNKHIRKWLNFSQKHFTKVNVINKKLAGTAIFKNKNTTTAYVLDKTIETRSLMIPQNLRKKFYVNITDSRDINILKENIENQGGSGQTLEYIVQKNNFIEFSFVNSVKQVKQIPQGLEFKNNSIKGTIINSGIYNIRVLYNNDQEQIIKITVPYYERIL